MPTIKQLNFVLTYKNNIVLPKPIQNPHKILMLKSVLQYSNFIFERRGLAQDEQEATVRCSSERPIKKIDDREIGQVRRRRHSRVPRASSRGSRAERHSRNVHADGARSRVRERPVHLDEVLPLSRLWNAMSFEKGQKEKRTKRQ